MKDRKNTTLSRRLCSALLALCMALSLLPAFERGARADFSDSSMDKLVNWGVVGGYPDGSLRPERNLTRAEFVAMVNRAYGYNTPGETPFYDVSPSSWYYDDIGSAYKVGYFSGVSPHMAAPDEELTREQAVVLISRNMRLDPIPGEVTEFEDGRDCADWSRGYIRAAKQAGIIGGYPNGTYQPQGDITRGEMAVMLQRALGTLVNEPGEHTLSDVYGNVTISNTDTKLKDTTIAGNLYITGGLDLGDIVVENVRVLGDIIVAGGGESHQGESIILRNVEADSLLVDSIADQYVSLGTEGNTEIPTAVLRSDAYVQDRTRPGQGLLNISLDSPDDPATFTLSGNLENVINKTAGSTLNVAMGTVDNLTIDEFARNAKLNLDVNSTTKTLNLDVGTEVSGVGDIDKLYVNAPGAVVDILPDTITIRPGVVATITGEEMNAAQAIESSSDPRLLAGYPKVRNIAPTNATSISETNKAGTVYWAVSTTTDGSIPEDELVNPTDDNTRIALNGDLAVAEANKEVSAALETLVPDTNYYLSAVMVDARDRHSPVKVASFVTPDNTTPAFTTGYPVVLRNYCESMTISGKENGADVTLIDRDSEQFPRRNYRVQVAAMPNKNCQLYYALYEAGSTAPTAAQFRTGALGKPIRSGVEDATKNRINYIELTNLDELKNYDVYLCLIDADGARSSTVQKLTFRTVDGKPPRFQYDTPAVAEEGINSLRLNVNVNENATVYWVASKSDKYIKDNLDVNGNSEWNDQEWWERACRQIEGGGGGNVVRNGSMAVRANTDTLVNVAGLDPATSYYIYFVAKDAAGNYSEFFRADHDYDVKNSLGVDRPEVDVKHNEQPYKYFIQANTLDNVPPEVKQDFTHFDATDNTRPYADTDVKLIFSEEVMQYSTNRSNTQETLVTFKSLYDKVLAAKSKAEAEPANADAQQELSDARDALAEALRSTIKLYNTNATGNESVVDRSDPYTSDKDKEKWIIDYRYVEVDVDDDTGELTLFFPGEYSQKDSDKWAVNLSSGSTYYFILDDISDISTSRNRMGRTQLENFTTVSAQVQLRSINVTSVNWQKSVGAPAVSVPIDMAFSMTPVTTNVEDDVDWDILFWSDSSVSFEIYELDPDRGTGVPVRQVTNGEAVGDPSSVSIINKNAAINQDTRLDDYLGYEGRSLFRDFYKLSFFPGVTGKNEKHLISTTDAALKESGIMTNDVPKYYGVHFTAIGSEPESTGREGGIWDATVNFRISVLTGASNNLLTLSRSITKDKLQEAEDDLGISQIHSPRPFFLRTQFANSEAPEFASSWPQFENTDTTMTINVELTRPGTLYWVVAPASTKIRQSDNTTRTNYVPTIDTYAYVGSDDGVKLEYDDSAEKTAANYGRYFTRTAASGEGAATYRLVPLNGSDTTAVAGATVPKPYELVTPANDQIYAPNFTSDRIKSDSINLARGIGTIEVTDLEPDTIYLVYFVMQGTGQVYSPRAQVFQTRTEEIRRPHLVLTNNTNSATVTSTNMNARADCGLFLLDRLKDMPLFSTKLKNVLDPEQAADFESRYPYNATTDEGRKDENGNPYHEYTVLEAMRQRDLDGRGGSLFDIYAAEDYKNQVAQLIRAEGSSDRIDGRRDLYIPGGSTSGVEYTTTKMVNDATYALLVVARADAGEDNASGHSLGFGAAYSLYVRDDNPPKLTAVSGNMEVDYQATGASATVDKFLMGGTVVLTFDRPLYLYRQADETRTALTSSNIDDKDGDGFLAAGSDSSITVSAVTGSGSTAVQTVRLTLPADSFQNDTTLYVNPLLAGQYSPAREQHPLQITLHFDTALQRVVAQMEKSTSDLWLTEGTSTVIPTRVIAPSATDITLNTSTLTLQKGGTGELSAELIPAGSVGEIRWTVENGAGFIGISPSTGTTTTVTGSEISGNTVITVTAHLYVNNVEVTSAKKSCTVRVTPILLSDIVLSATSINLTATNARTQIVTVTVLPDDASNREINVAAVDPSLVSITKVPLSNNRYELRITRATPTSAGETMVTVAAADGGPAYNYFYVTITN